MHLLVLLVIFLLVGYVLADSRFNERINRAAEDVVTTSKNLAGNVEYRWKSLFKRRSPSDAFRNWATRPDAGLPQEFTRWLSGLSRREADDFIQALAGYARGLGFDLNSLVEGGLDNEPILRQVFVEAIVVYSDAYRKARKALEEAEEAEVNAAEDSSTKDGKKPAAKQASRRKRDAVEAPETASVA